MTEETIKHLARAWYAERIDAPIATVHAHVEQDALVTGWWYVVVWCDTSRVVYGLEVSPAGEVCPMEA